MSMSDQIKQQVVQEFYPQKGLTLLENLKRQNWILLFYQSVRSSNHMENILYILSPGSVAHCFKLLHNARYRILAAAVNQFLIFFPLLGPHVLALFCYLLMFIILRGLLHLV